MSSITTTTTTMSLGLPRITILGRKNPWPDPLLSIGECWCSMGQDCCWEPIGPAKEKFDEISHQIKNLLNSRGEYLSEGICVRRRLIFEMYMIGRTAELAKPTIIFSSENKTQCQRAKKLVKESGILSGCPGIGLGDSRRPLRLSRSPKPLGEQSMFSDDIEMPTWTGSSSLPEASIWYSSQLNGMPCIPVTVKREGPEAPSSIRKSTLGAVFIDNELMGLTVAHAFFDESDDESSSGTDLELSLDDDDEAEDAFEFTDDFINMTSRGSASPEQWPETSRVLLEKPTWPEKEPGTTSHDETNSNEKNRIETIEASPKYLGRIFAISLQTTTTNLDWALVRIECADFRSSISETIEIPRNDHIEPPWKGAKTVHAITGSSGSLAGRITGSSTFIQLPGSTAFQEVWAVQLDGPLQSGDSGSWIIDPSSGGLYGHIVVGDPQTSIAYIVPAHQTFSAIEQQLGSKVTLASQERLLSLKKSAIDAGDPMDCASESGGSSSDSWWPSEDENADNAPYPGSLIRRHKTWSSRPTTPSETSYDHEEIDFKSRHISVHEKPTATAGLPPLDVASLLCIPSFGMSSPPQQHGYHSLQYRQPIEQLPEKQIQPGVLRSGELSGALSLLTRELHKQRQSVLWSTDGLDGPLVLPPNISQSHTRDLKLDQNTQRQTAPLSNIRLSGPLIPPSVISESYSEDLKLDQNMHRESVSWSEVTAGSALVPPQVVSESRTEDPQLDRSTQRHTHLFGHLARSERGQTVGSNKEPQLTILGKHLTRGRQRGLTDLEKKQARDVRDAKACWACHISKTKCSPCSPGKPCEQCARLAGKGRFCLFECFNDPLESLTTFLVPKYLFGHLNRAKIEAFITKNANGWGKTILHVNLIWGMRRAIDADVVDLKLPVNSELALTLQAKSLVSGESASLIRTASPPLGIPLADLDIMEQEYARYVQDIVTDDLSEYVNIAYSDQESTFPERVLGIICSFLLKSRSSDQDYQTLQRAVEMHVIFTILERSLILDAKSLQLVENELQEHFEPASAPRCAQRQIKLAFFNLQCLRAGTFLKVLGQLLWTTSPSKQKSESWVISFCLLLLLTLAIDKNIISAHYLCESRIMHDGQDPKMERAAFEKLITLTERELFERSKEIFHWKFRTRKGGKEACNPIRDGAAAFGRFAVPEARTAELVLDLQELVQDFEPQIRAHCSQIPQDSDASEYNLYTDAGRLTRIFLDDFLNR